MWLPFQWENWNIFTSKLCFSLKISDYDYAAAGKQFCTMSISSNCTNRTLSDSKLKKFTFTSRKMKDEMLTREMSHKEWVDFDLLSERQNETSATSAGLRRRANVFCYFRRRALTGKFSVAAHFQRNHVARKCSARGESQCVSSRVFGVTGEMKIFHALVFWCIYRFLKM